ncbi:MAG TPA: N,N-dimethylformamidase beta subunit family domain-containing protein [Telluria sp.]|jgi:hypothetical protein
MIFGYAARASVRPGETLTLHISASAARFRVIIYRWSGQLVAMQTSAWFAGESAPMRDPALDWHWPAYHFPVPRTWPTGVYLAHLEEPGAAPLHLAQDHGAVLFVVRGSGRRLLYKIPLATYNAYNHAGGGCFYDQPPRSAAPPGARLSLRRPGIGIGAPTFGAADFYDSSSARQTFAHWDARFIGWLLARGYAPDFCTDLDIHNEPELCRPYRLLISAGHDEYWSTAMRDGVEAFVAAGGNAAFFSANLCWWRIHLVDHAAAMVCHQGGPHGAHDHWWPERPEDTLAGVSYRHGGGWWDGPRVTAGYTVLDPGHWVFAGTGLRQGDSFGAHTRPPLVGYECDGAPLASFDPGRGTATLSPAAGACGTPENFHLLAACALDARWQERPQREAAAGSLHAATMGLFTRGGTVFTAGTTDWVQALDSNEDPHLSAITHNVIDRLLEQGSHSCN